MDTPPLRLAVVGLGAIAREVHLPTLQRLPGVEVVGLVDAVPAALRRATAETGLDPGFASVEALIETTRPDGALVLTPKQSHYVVVRTLLEAGVDVFCEKPLTTRLPEGPRHWWSWRPGPAGFSWWGSIGATRRSTWPPTRRSPRGRRRRASP